MEIETKIMSEGQRNRKQVRDEDRLKKKGIPGHKE